MNQTNPLVSVICPSYSHEPYLRQALDSILMQKTNFPFEVLIGEDCSPDHSREILKEYEQQYPGFFQMFFREKNMGATNNSLDLSLRARGKYIIVLETDDYWTDPCKLQKQVDFLGAHPEYIGCAHDYKTVDANDRIISEYHFDDSMDNIFTLQDFLNKGFGFQTATLMHYNIFQDGNDYSIITRAHPLVGDLTILSILLSRGDIFIMADNMSAYRRVIKIGGSNARSIGITHLAKSLQATMRQLVMLEEYFHGKIDYSPMKRYPVERYLSGWLRRENGFTAAGMWYMWKNAGPSVRKKAVCFLLGYPVRKLRKCWSRLLKKDDAHE